MNIEYHKSVNNTYPNITKEGIYYLVFSIQGTRRRRRIFALNDKYILQ